MAIVYTFPQIAGSDLVASDLLLLSKMNAIGRPTKSLTLKDLADFITSTGTGTGTTNAVVKWVDGPSGLLGDSPINIVDGGAGLKQAILTDGYKMVVDRDATTTVGDPEFAVTQNGVQKTSFGWDDDGGGFGFLYNWAGNGFKIGSTALYPQFEILTNDPDFKNISFADFQLAPTGVGPSVGSFNLDFKGVDDTGAELVGGRIFTLDSSINPSGQDIYFQNADDNGVLQTNIFIDAFGNVGVAKTNPNAILDVGGSTNLDTTLSVGTTLTVGTDVTFSSYGAGTKTGTATFNLEVDANGNVIETAATVGIPWPYQYDAALGNLLQGENPGTTQVGITTFGVGAGANLGPTSGGAPGDSGNTAIGYNALNLENNEVQCTAVGYKALANQNVSSMFATPSNTAIGYEAGKECTLGLANVFVGNEVQSVNSGQSIGNVAVGSRALRDLGTGFANVAIGERALFQVASNTGNIAIGYTANNGLTTGDQNIVIGYDAQPSSLTVSNEITIGNTNNDKFRLPGLQVSASDGDVLTYKAATGTISFNSNKGNTIINGLVNNLGSAGSGGYDFMEWVSNVTSSTQIPVMKTPRALTLRSLSYAWMGDTALSIGVGEQVAFTIGTIPSGSNPVIGNYTSVLSLFDLTNADDGTYANGVVSGLSQVFNIGDVIGVVGQETGTVTPNNGELSITFEFEIN
jgi:hypothetical protein